MAHYIVRTSKAISMETLGLLYTRRTRRAGLPLAVTASSSPRSLGDLRRQITTIPRILKIDSRESSPVPSALDVKAVEGLRAFGSLGFVIPLTLEGQKSSEDSQCYFSVGPRRWLLAFSLDARTIEAPQRRAIFDELLSSPAWPAKTADAEGGRFVFQRDGDGPRWKAYGVGRRAADPDRISLSDQEAWSRGLEPYRAVVDQFAKEGQSWSWKFEISVLAPPAPDARAEDLWDSLEGVGLPTSELSLTCNLHVAAVDELETLRRGFGPKDSAIADLVSLKLSPGYTADIDVISTHEGHFVEADLKGGWGDEERKAFEELLGASLVDAG